MAKKSRPLNARQRKFVELYDGNGTQSAKKAGYTGSDKVLGETARDLLENPVVSAAIRARETKELRPSVATRRERQEWWTTWLRDPKLEMAARQKASELLAKSEGDFTTNVQVSGTLGLTLEQLVTQSMVPPPPPPAAPKLESPPVEPAQPADVEPTDNQKRYETE